MMTAATDIYEKHFYQWRLSSGPLDRLEALFPEWNEESCLIKAVAINELYGTNVYLIVPLARNIAKVMRTNPLRKRA